LVEEVLNFPKIPKILYRFLTEPKLKINLKFTLWIMVKIS